MVVHHKAATNWWTGEGWLSALKFHSLLLLLSIFPSLFFIAAHTTFQIFWFSFLHHILFTFPFHSVIPHQCTTILRVRSNNGSLLVVDRWLILYWVVLLLLTISFFGYPYIQVIVFFSLIWYGVTCYHSLYILRSILSSIIKLIIMNVATMSLCR